MTGDVSLTRANTFEPEELTVASGETVVFSNDSDAAHTVTAYEDELPEGADFFASGGEESEDGARDDLAAGLIKPGESMEVTFEQPGTYQYFCIPHEQQGMTGEIVVE